MIGGNLAVFMELLNGGAAGVDPSLETENGQTPRTHFHHFSLFFCDQRLSFQSLLLLLQISMSSSAAADTDSGNLWSSPIQDQKRILILMMMTRG